MKDRNSVLIIGASRGLGHQLVECFRSDGWQVFGTTTRGIPEKSRESITWLHCDLTSEDSWRNVAARFPAGIGRVVFCSAYDPRAEGIPELDSQIRSLIINGAAAYALLSELTHSSNGASSIAVVNTEAIYHPNVESAGYAAGKAALKMYTASLSRLCYGKAGATFEIILGPLQSPVRAQRAKKASERLRMTVAEVEARALANSNPELAISRFIRVEECFRLILCGFELGATANGASFRLDGGSGGALR